jgi:hypothetical protein
MPVVGVVDVGATITMVEELPAQGAAVLAP